MVAALSIIRFASFDRKMPMAAMPTTTQPAFSGTPSSALSPREAPPTLPILKARPPSATRNAIKNPRPGSTLLAISCPRIPETPIIRQTFTCVETSSRMAQTITAAKDERYWAVKVEVWVRKPGPIAEVAIRNAAPRRTEAFALSFFGAVTLVSSLLLMLFLLFGVVVL